MSALFEIIIYTAAQEDYANAILDVLDPSSEIITYRLYRNHCTKIAGLHLKDISVIVNRSASDMIVVDNILYSFALNPKNGIPIKSYIKGEEDCELHVLVNSLEKYDCVGDSRVFIEESFKVGEFYSWLEKEPILQ